MDAGQLIDRTERTVKRVRRFVNAVCLIFLALAFGPALIVIGLNALPPALRPGLNYPVAGQSAPASVEKVQLALRHVLNNPQIDNVEAQLALTLAYTDRAGHAQHAYLSGPWVLQPGTQHTGDAAWSYLGDVGGTLGSAPLAVDMPADLAQSLATVHKDFKIDEETVSNLDRPLRWAAVAWLAAEHPLSVRFDPRAPEVAVPEALIARESARLQGAGILRAGAFVLGCLIVAALAWKLLFFAPRAVRALGAALVLIAVPLWAPHTGTLMRIVLPGMETLTGLDMDAVAANPLAPFYDTFVDGPCYTIAKQLPPVQGSSWSPDSLSAHELTAWLRSIPPQPMHATLDAAEDALAKAAMQQVPSIDTARLQALDAELVIIALRQAWSGSGDYGDLHDAVRRELNRREGVPNA